MLWYRIGGTYAPRHALNASADKLVVRREGRDGLGATHGQTPRPEALATFAELETYAELAFVLETHPPLTASFRRLAASPPSRRGRPVEHATALHQLRLQLRSAGISRRLAVRLDPNP